MGRPPAILGAVTTVPRLLAVATLALVLGGCASLRTTPVDQRTTQGPLARELWTLRMVAQNGREPSFDERRHWDNAMESRINDYLRKHPEAANSLELSTFRFTRQVVTGMTKEQVLILLGAPETVTTDQAELEKLARGYWTDIKGNATEAWVYPFGWRMFYAGQRLVDITRHVPD
jgi:hypothetical protein